MYVLRHRKIQKHDNRFEQRNCAKAVTNSGATEHKLSTTNPHAPRDFSCKQYNKQACYVVPICNQIYSVDVPIAEGLFCLCTMPQISNTTTHYAYTFRKQT